MTERLGQVAEALLSLDEFSHRTTQQVQAMSERLHHIASSGDELVSGARPGRQEAQELMAGWRRAVRATLSWARDRS